MTHRTPLVLLMEDEPVIAYTLEEELTEANFQVLSVGQSRKTIEIIVLQESPYRALVTDIDLGGGLARGCRS